MAQFGIIFLEKYYLTSLEFITKIKNNALEDNLYLIIRQVLCYSYKKYTLVLIKVQSHTQSQIKWIEYYIVRIILLYL